MRPPSVAVVTYEGKLSHFEVPSEFIGRGVDPTRVDMYSDPDVGDTWTATALLLI